MRPAQLHLTEHAVDRYVERWRPGWTRDAARDELAKGLALTQFVEIDRGDYIYRTPRGALLVVAGDGAVRTVLPMGSKKITYRPRRKK